MINKKISCIIVLFTVFMANSAVSETFTVEARMSGEIPFFGMTANNLASIVREELVSRGHNVVSQGDINTPRIMVDYAGWSTQIDNGRTILGKAEGVIMIYRPYAVATEHGKAKKGQASYKTEMKFLGDSYRICSGIASDDRRSVLQDGFRQCVANFIRY